jgi:AcrR family transcriptional regulator
MRSPVGSALWTYVPKIRTSVHTMLRLPKDARVFAAPERRRRQILDAALELVGEGGPDAVTHRAVAKRAKVSLGSTTYHYGSREELMRAAFRHYLAEVKAFFELVGVKTPRTRIADVVDLAVAVASRSTVEPVAVRAEYELILHGGRDPLLAREFVAYQRTLEGELARLLEHLDIRRPHDAARTVIDMVRGFELEHLTRPDADTEDLRRRVRSFIDALATQERISLDGERTRARRRTPPARIKAAPARPRRKTTR